MNTKGNYILTLLLITVSAGTIAQQPYVSKVWVADNGNGTYKNPVIHADYSDPDVIKVGKNYYLTASSFDAVPGLPILQSNDLVNWTIIGHALIRIPPYDHFSKTQHGNGVWAPSIRYHHNEFYIYFPDPDFGIYLIKAKNIIGPWTDPILVEAGKGLIDPCPIWDDNGKVYLIHAFAGSRTGIKSILIIKKLNGAGTKVVDKGVLIYDGHEKDPTIEGPKIYKRDHYYYIFAPAGGVSNGWQLVLRSKSIYGPYERKVVMDQGRSSVNGPHQGAWLISQNGEDWFIHFQDKGAYGRVVHLEPMKWINHWPVIGVAQDSSGKGEPVAMFKKPDVGKTYPFINPVESDEFNSLQLGLQWQWQANPKPYWYFFTGNNIRLYAIRIPEGAKNYWDVPNMLLQKFPAEEFTVTSKFLFKPNLEGEKTGIVIMGTDYACMSLIKKADGVYLEYTRCMDAQKGNPEIERLIEKLKSPDLYLRINVTKGAVCHFSYSYDDIEFTDFSETFIAKPGKWIGAKIGLFCTRTTSTNDSGYADIDWFRIDK